MQRNRSPEQSIQLISILSEDDLKIGNKRLGRNRRKKLLENKLYEETFKELLLKICENIDCVAYLALLNLLQNYKHHKTYFTNTGYFMNAFLFLEYNNYSVESEYTPTLAVTEESQFLLEKPVNVPYMVYFPEQKYQKRILNLMSCYKVSKLP